MHELTASRSPSSAPGGSGRGARGSAGGGRTASSAWPRSLAAAIVRSMNSLHARVAAEVGVDVALRLVALDAELLRQAERRDAVDDPEVDRLGAVALVARQRRPGLPSTSAAVARCTSSPRWNAPASACSPREVREDAQLDLRVVGGQQPRARLGDEGAADLAAERACAPGCSAGSGSCSRAGRWPRWSARTSCGCGRRRRSRAGSGDQVRVECSFDELAPALDHGHDRVQVADLREHALVGRVAGLALAVGGQAEPLEQHLAELLRRADRERAAGELVGPLLELGDLVGHAARRSRPAGTGRRGRRRPPSPPARSPAAARRRPGAACRSRSSRRGASQPRSTSAP